MDNKRKSIEYHRQAKAPKMRGKARVSFEKLANNLVQLVRWWSSRRQPSEVTVMIRLIEIVGLVLVVLILAAVGKLEEIGKVLKCLNGCP